MIFSPFERMVAMRYLRARRQEGFISVIAGFSLMGIGLGVATLIIVMAVMNCFRAELLGRVLGLNGHLNVFNMVPGPLAGFDDVAARIRNRPGVVNVTPTVEGQALISMHDWTFVLGQSLFPAISALLLGSLLYQSRLVPRVLPVIGFIGAPLLVASSIATMFGVNHYGSGISGIAGLPIAVWEFSLGAYLVIKGFRPAGLQKLGFETDESAEPASASAATAPESKLRPAA